MPDLYRCADVFLHLAKEESFGIAYLEALASGLPIVAQDSPVARWVLEDQAAFVELADAAGVAEALDAATQLCKPEHLAARAALVGRRTWTASAGKYVEFMQRIHEGLERAQ